MNDREPTDRSETAETESFEASLARLERIVGQLEEGEVDLDESVRLFEEGVALARRLEARLTEAEMRVEKLLDATGRTAPLPEAESEDPEER